MYFSFPNKSFVKSPYITEVNTFYLKSTLRENTCKENVLIIIIKEMQLVLFIRSLLGQLRVKDIY